MLKKFGKKKLIFAGALLILLVFYFTIANKPKDTEDKDLGNYTTTTKVLSWNETAAEQDKISKLGEKAEVTPEKTVNEDGTFWYNFPYSQKAGKVQAFTDQEDTILVIKSAFFMDPNKQTIQEVASNKNPDLRMYVKCNMSLNLNVYKEEGFATEVNTSSKEIYNVFYFKPGDFSRLLSVLKDSYSRTPYSPADCNAY